MGEWVRSPFFLMNLRRSVILWLGFKFANTALVVFGSRLARIVDAVVAPSGLFAFRLGPELGAVLFAWLVLWWQMRRNGEDILLGNLAFSIYLVLAELAAVSLLLSLLLSQLVSFVVYLFT